MPFTLSHPAAVLPLLRSPFRPAALACGALAPDAPYFLGGAGIPVGAQSWYEPFLNATYSHTLPGLTVALPFALMLLALYRLVRRPVAGLLPPRLAASGVAGRTGSHPRRAGWVLLSALIGVLTHLAWDSFTHFDGYAVTHLSFLRSRVAGDLTVARVIQHLSTAGGLAAVAVHLWRRPRGPHPTAPSAGLPPAMRRSVVTALTAATLVGAAANLRTLETYRGGPGATTPATAQEVVEGIFADSAIGGGIALACALALYAAAWWAYGAVGRFRTSRAVKCVTSRGAARVPRTRNGPPPSADPGEHPARRGRGRLR
ncbi:DUF4184 family protein [Streptomyces sp. PSRA5]|uniref:DUF4184 family protein n=1 Tax=Streptomyces panacea TaxID=3035064 RepID=UPI00339C7A35